MKKTILISALLCSIILSSCETQSTLYYWRNYEKTSYNFYKKQTPESTEALLATYAQMIEKQTKSTRKIVPPGTYAEYGFLLIQNGKKEDGLAMLKNELNYYPESKVFVERIIKMLEK